MSTVGTKGVRDPTIIRAHDGSKFWIIATDLKMHGSNGGWDAAGRTGSRSIVIWESTNLSNWNGPRLVQVSPPTAGNTWAPEAFYDIKKEMYMVFWASALYAPSDVQHKNQSYYRIMRAMTKDFIQFTPAEVWIDTGYSVIDTTIVFDEKNGKFHRFSKDERAKTPDGKFIFQEWSLSLDGPWKSVKAGIGKGSISRGEGPTVVKSNTVPDKWHMFIDEFGGKLKRIHKCISAPY
jgi:sucrose-6-phosphate hydrolase SacC (GH32 family)